jgi:hypothetical protein
MDLVINTHMHSETLLSLAPIRFTNAAGGLEMRPVNAAALAPMRLTKAASQSGSTKGSYPTGQVRR